MARIARTLVALAVVTTLLVPPALAAGSSPAPTPTQRPSAPPKTPEEQAIDHYNAGLRMRDKAWKLEESIELAPNEKKRAKIEAKVERQYLNAVDEFKAATGKNPRLHQAHSSLGYALRKTGQYEAALEAYDRSLSLAPGYAEAIEYRAEAYLGLDRIEDAKRAYVKLFGMDRETADELLVAMKGWVEKRQSDPGGLTVEAVNEFASWVAERDELARQTASLSQQQARKW